MHCQFCTGRHSDRSKWPDHLEYRQEHGASADMTDPNDRFDALLEAMLTKPPVEPEEATVGDDDLREDDDC